MKKLTRVLALLLSVFLLLGIPVAAKTDYPHDYIVDTEENERVPIPVTHESVAALEKIEGYEPEDGDPGKLNNPQDIFIDDQDNIYIADSGNNAVLKLNSEGKLLLAITEADGKPLNYPLGVFVDENEDIFIADNRNQRILHMDKNGAFVEEFVAPETELISQELSVFDPAKIAINSTNGYLYMLLGKQFLTLDARNHFKGLVGAEQVGFDLADFLFRLFGSEKQQQRVGKRQPVSYNNFHITRNNEIYAVSMSETSQIKRINSIGNNTYPVGFYGEMDYEEDGTPIYPFFVDIAVTTSGMITVAEQHSSRLYQYDKEGNLLAAFGGEGENRGKFQLISSIAYDSRDRLYVLDATRGDVQILEPTTFLADVQQATTLYQEGRYDESLQIWNKVNQTATNYPNAKQSIANIYYKQKNYSGALGEYVEANDREGYGKTVGQLRFSLYSRYFAPIAIGGLLLVALIVWLVLFLRRKSLRTEASLYEKVWSRPREFFKMCLLMFYHPVRGLAIVKRNRQHINWIPVVCMPIALIFVRILAVYGTSFTVSSIRPQDASILFEIAIVLVPYLTLGFSLYGLTSIMSGEMTMYETFSGLAYSLLPMTIFWPVLTLISGAVSNGEAGLFHGAQILLYVWTVLLVLTSVMHLNNISVRRTVGVSALSVVGVAVILVTVLLLVAFTSQLVYFFMEIASEVNGLSL